MSSLQQPTSHHRSPLTPTHRSEVLSKTDGDGDLPVSVTEAKEHLRITGTDLDNQVEAALRAAVDWCERVTGRALRVEHQIRQSYSEWPCNPVRLDRQPVKQIDTIQYYDQSGSLTTLNSSNYRLIISTDAAGYLELDDNLSEPATDTRDDAVQITYTAGYASLAVVPACATQAMRLMLTVFFGELMPRELESHERAAKTLLGAIDWGAYR